MAWERAFDNRWSASSRETARRHPGLAAAARRVAGLVFLIGLLALPLAGRPAPAAAAAWQDAGLLPASAEAPRAALLPDGRVLVVNGKTAAFYSFEANNWSAAPPPPQETRGGELRVLADGRAYLIGGVVSTFLNDPYALTKQVLRFDPGKNTWTTGASMANGRGQHTLTPLPDGRLLAVGGVVTGLSPRQPWSTNGAVELYDPQSNTWTKTAPLKQVRFDHTATLLADGRVLVAGGSFSKTVNSENAGSEAVASVEIYDPATGVWTDAAPLSRARTGHRALLLHDGSVLVVGGTGVASAAERYDPQANSWSPAGSPGVGPLNFTATLLLTGEVLVAGGAGNDGAAVAATAIYTPGSNSWSPAPALSVARTRHAAVLVDGHVLAIGGSGVRAAASAERYDTTPPGAVCSVETGYCATAAFQTYWTGHGKLPISGYPISNPFAEKLEDGQIHLVQYFERVRMEAHKAAPPYDVQLGQFGRKLHPAEPAVPARAGAAYFEKTGHNVDGGFLAYWQANGGIDQFGEPLTEVFSETLEDGQTYDVQYFERARFEYHPKNAEPYKVQLGQFGRRILAGR